MGSIFPSFQQEGSTSTSWMATTRLNPSEIRKMVSIILDNSAYFIFDIVFIDNASCNKQQPQIAE